MSLLPLRSEPLNAIWVPSGDQDGSMAPQSQPVWWGRRVTCCGVVSSMFATKSCGCSAMLRTNAICVPSGDTATWYGPTPLMSDGCSAPVATSIAATDNEAAEPTDEAVGEGTAGCSVRPPNRTRPTANA